MSKKVVRILRLLIELRYKYLFQFSIVIVERGSKLEVGENTKIIKSKIVVKNRHNLQIGNSCIIKKCTLSFYSDNGWRESSIGSNGNFNGVYLQAYGSFKCGDWNIFEQKSNTPMLTVFNGSLDIGHHNRFMNRFWIRYNANVRIGNYNNINERSWLRADEQITIGEEGAEVEKDHLFPIYMPQDDFLYYASRGMISVQAQYVYNREKFMKRGGFINFPFAWNSDAATAYMMSDGGVLSTPSIVFTFRKSSIHITGDGSIKKQDSEIDC